MKKLTFRFKGGPGSGFHGHKGRPGKVGGSSSDGEGTDGGKSEMQEKVSYGSFMELDFPVKNPEGGVNKRTGFPISPLHGSSLYKMPSEDRPSWGVHGGETFLTSKGYKIVKFFNDNEGIIRNLTKTIPNSKYTIDSAISHFNSATYGMSEGEFSNSLGTLSSHEAGRSFSDIADLYRDIHSAASKLRSGR